MMKGRNKKADWVGSQPAQIQADTKTDPNSAVSLTPFPNSYHLSSPITYHPSPSSSSTPSLLRQLPLFQLPAPVHDLLLHLLRRRAAGGLLLAHAHVRENHLEYIRFERRRECMECFELKIAEEHSVTDTVGDHASRHFMGLAEGQSFADEIVGHVRRRQVIGPELLGHVLFVERRMDQDLGHDEQAFARRLVDVEQRDLVFLHIPVIRERKAFHLRQQTDERV